MKNRVLTPSGRDKVEERMPQNLVIIFVCEHGAAKSVIAATYFNQLAREQHLNLFAIARGTHPDVELSSKTIAGLREDGLIPTESTPQELSAPDMEAAQRIITFCELPAAFQNKVPTEQWNDIPLVSDDYKKARDAILRKLSTLLEK